MTKNHSHKAVVLLLSFIIPFIASAYDCEVDGIRYNLDKSTQTASVTSGNYSGIVHIPEKIEYNGATYIVAEIGERAFYSCYGLTGITIPNSVTNIGKYAFSQCIGLIGTLTIPNSVTNIGDYAFWYCSLTSIDVDSGNPNYASYNGVLFSKDMTRLIQCPGGFFGSFVIPNSVTNIGDDAFYCCRGLTSITIPNSVTNIGEWAFRSCSGLTSVTIPNSVTEIGEMAFSSCSGLMGLIIGNSVTTIGDYAFAGCTNLTSIDVDSDNPNYASYKGVLFSKDMTLLIQCPGGFSGSFVIPNSVKEIGIYAFGYCRGMTSITIPNSVTNIGMEAFNSCRGLTEITIPNSVTNIGSFAFYDCKGLTGTLTIPNSVTNIGERAFCGCSGLTELTIPNSVTEIGIYAFGYCSGLTSITIPNSVTNISDYAFGYCSGLTNITISNSVTNIGELAFYGCSSLTSIDVDSDNPNYASYNGVLFSKDMTLLIQCPEGFSGLFVIPNSVTDIGGRAFFYCSSLTGITIPNSVTNIGDDAFYYCSSLTGTLTIPNSVANIGMEAFLGCYGLTSITIPNSVTSIGNYAFYDCKGLTEITIGNGITEIGNGAFHGCTDLTSVYYNAQNPITSDEYLFSKYSATLYVPKGAVDTFKATTPWNKFNKIEEYDFGGVADVIADKSGEIDYTLPYEIYNFNGAKVSDNKDTLAPGLYIIRQGTTTKKISVQ